jgi:caa(3)-type oxidase subunit IV
MSSQTTIHHPNYVKVWAILVVLLLVSVMAPFVGLRWLTLVTAFAIAVVKASMVAKNFMHLNIEKRWVAYLLAGCLIFMLLLFSGVAPDVARHRGLQWINHSAEQSVESGMNNATAQHE